MKRYQTGALTEADVAHIARALEARNQALEALLGRDHEETSGCFNLMHRFLNPDEGLIELDDGD